MTLIPFPSIDHERIDFDRYLRAALKTQVIGTNQSQDCPLSRWLSNLHRKPVHVTIDAIWIDGVGYETPAWMADFQSEIDERARRSVRHERITPRQAIGILASVSEEQRRAA